MSVITMTNPDGTFRTLELSEWTLPELDFTTDEAWANKLLAELAEELEQGGQATYATDLRGIMARLERIAKEQLE